MPSSISTVITTSTMKKSHILLRRFINGSSSPIRLGMFVIKR